MTIDLSSFAQKSNNGGWTEDQQAFLTALTTQRLRISYGGASVLKLPDATPGLNRGRHGCAIVKNLPVNLQPIVCRQDGTYHEKAHAAFEAIENFDDTFDGLETWNIIPAAAVLEAFAEFTADATDDATDEE